MGSRQPTQARRSSGAGASEVGLAAAGRGPGYRARVGWLVPRNPEALRTAHRGVDGLTLLTGGCRGGVCERRGRPTRLL